MVQWNDITWENVTNVQELSDAISYLRQSVLLEDKLEFVEHCENNWSDLTDDKLLSSSSSFSSELLEDGEAIPLGRGWLSSSHISTINGWSVDK